MPLPNGLPSPVLEEKIADSREVCIPEQALTKVVLKMSGTEETKETVKKDDAAAEGGKGVKTYINCDLRYFNFRYLTDRLGYFDVVLIDPPWRIKGGERNDSSFMFSNSR